MDYVDHPDRLRFDRALTWRWLLAVLHVIIREELYDKQFVE